MAAQKSILNAQQLGEAMPLSEDKMFDNEDDSSEDENRNDRPTESNNAIPKESPLPSPNLFATCSRPNILTAINNKSVTPSRFDSSSPGGNDVLLKNNAVFSQLSHISSSPPLLHYIQESTMNVTSTELQLLGNGRLAKNVSSLCFFFCNLT
jgi:hypothetical protein